MAHAIVVMRDIETRAAIVAAKLGVNRDNWAVARATGGVMPPIVESVISAFRTLGASTDRDLKLAHVASPRGVEVSAHARMIAAFNVASNLAAG